ncbi:hypothetical protein LCGC14_1953740 [marine sediment metagenome]|uniref:Uncharacterized protein n=1 Tax=marine sediment metagenome TaxID=412755 RepID=A0A0F9FGZ1_9ZZZZ
MGFKCKNYDLWITHCITNFHFCSKRSFVLHFVGVLLPPFSFFINKFLLLLGRNSKVGFMIFLARKFYMGVVVSVGLQCGIVFHRLYDSYVFSGFQLSHDSQVIEVYQLKVARMFNKDFIFPMTRI